MTNEIFHSVNILITFEVVTVSLSVCVVWDMESAEEMMRPERHMGKFYLVEKESITGKQSSVS